MLGALGGPTGFTGSDLMEGPRHKEVSSMEINFLKIQNSSQGT